MNPLRDLSQALVMPFKALFVVGLCAVINAMTYSGHWWVKWVALGMGIATVVALAEGLLEADVIGRTSFDMGRTALLEIGAVKVVVSEHVGVGGNHPIVYQRFGIDPATAKMAVLKTASNFQYYHKITTEIIRVDTPGPTMSHLEQFNWRHVPRPIYPLDDLREWSPDMNLARR